METYFRNNDVARQKAIMDNIALDIKTGYTSIQNISAYHLIRTEQTTSTYIGTYCGQSVRRYWEDVSATKNIENCTCNKCRQKITDEQQSSGI